ncbi:replicative DNA helicase [Caldinitratiruptor microaerophilus]|uniref:Replicative DNA helicase n=1 Tax=Caldinitratiruptor microaerophilus TaxID=671077 RepID=A0AA35CNS1_9FIRM|nr:replicative DNA helicase [Caldinitratiruptor microaerophilus]BDG61843.1 replicative DNA helicase [Caldinitratiruptor microaerophilus]
MSTFSERVPPQNLEAEQSVLGAMLLERDAALQVAGILSPEDFYADRHRVIFQAMQALAARGEPVDLITVSEELRRAGQLEEAGGLTYLTYLQGLVPTAANAEAYALIVEQKAMLRRLQQAARQIIEEAYDAEDADAMLSQAESLILGVTQRRPARGYEHIREALYAAFDHIEFLYSHKGGTTGVPSGYRELDRLTSGWQPSDLIIIAARPSMGKTAFVLNLARNAAMAGRTVALFSLEMSREQVAMRLLSMEAAVDAHRLRTGQLLDDDWHRLSAGLSRLAEANIFIDDTPNIPLADLRSRARRIQAEHGLDMVIVDYLQLMTLSGAGGRRASENRVQEVAEISRSLKALARELRVPVIALSQLSRAVESRNDKRPLLSDLRESGSLEQDADVVIFLYRDDYYNQESEKPNLCEVIIAKQRNGPVDSVELYFMKEIGKFMMLERRSSSG